MAIFVPLIVGVLSAFALSLALGARAADAPRWPRIGAAGGAVALRMQPAEVLRAVAHAVGAALLPVVRSVPGWRSVVGAFGRIPAVHALITRQGVPSLQVRGCADEARHEVALLGALALAAGACGVAAGILAWSVLAVVPGAVIPVGCCALSARRRERAERRWIDEEMPEAFSALSIALGSGHTLAQGMRFVGSHAQEPIKGEFTRVAFAIECGVPAPAALDDLLERLPASGLGLVSLALKVSQRTGAPLRGLLAEAADMVGDKIELLRRLDVKTSQARMSARLVACMPVAMVALLALLSSDFRDGLATSVGMGSVIVALMLNLAAWGIIRRIMEVDCNGV